MIVLLMMSAMVKEVVNLLFSWWGEWICNFFSISLRVQVLIYYKEQADTTMYSVDMNEFSD